MGGVQVTVSWPDPILVLTITGRPGASEGGMLCYPTIDGYDNIARSPQQLYLIP